MQDLPNEIVLEIARNLEGIDLGRFSMVNKECYNLLEKGLEEVKNIIKESCEIIFRIKISKDGSFEREGEELDEEVPMNQNLNLSKQYMISHHILL